MNPAPATLTAGETTYTLDAIAVPAAGVGVAHVSPVGGTVTMSFRLTVDPAGFEMADLMHGNLYAGLSAALGAALRDLTTVCVALHAGVESSRGSSARRRTALYAAVFSELPQANRAAALAMLDDDYLGSAADLIGAATTAHQPAATSHVD